MIKHYCDICGSVITEKNAAIGGSVAKTRLGGTIKSRDSELKWEIITSLDGCANKGDFCKYCIIDAVMLLDDRKRPVD